MLKPSRDDEPFTRLEPTFTLRRMEVHIKPETESRLHELATKSGRAADELVEDALAGYLGEIAAVREMLDGRYHDVTTKSVTTMDGEEAFFHLRQKSKDRRS